MIDWVNWGLIVGVCASEERTGGQTLQFAFSDEVRAEMRERGGVGIRGGWYILRDRTVVTVLALSKVWAEMRKRVNERAGGYTHLRRPYRTSGHEQKV
uniref:Uncharacterized protein n=1 Tax=Brugia malayi TaxID=6279 RepID=A8NJ55_BRUMA